MNAGRYDLPNPLGSAEQAKRYEHGDLPGLSDFALWQEQQRVEWVLAWDDRPDGWLLKRWKAIKAERRRRGGR